MTVSPEGRQQLGDIIGHHGARSSFLQQPGHRQTEIGKEAHVAFGFGEPQRMFQSGHAIRHVRHVSSAPAPEAPAPRSGRHPPFFFCRLEQLVQAGPGLAAMDGASPLTISTRAIAKLRALTFRSFLDLRRAQHRIRPINGGPKPVLRQPEFELKTFEAARPIWKLGALHQRARPLQVLSRRLDVAFGQLQATRDEIAGDASPARRRPVRRVPARATDDPRLPYQFVPLVQKLAQPNVHPADDRQSQTGPSSPAPGWTTSALLQYAAASRRRPCLRSRSASRAKYMRRHEAETGRSRGRSSALR